MPPQQPAVRPPHNMTLKCLVTPWVSIIPQPSMGAAAQRDAAVTAAASSSSGAAGDKGNKIVRNYRFASNFKQPS